MPPAPERRSAWGRLVVRVVVFDAPKLASSLRKAWARLRNPHADVSFGKHSYVGPGFSLHAPFGGSFSCGPGTEFRRGFRCELGGPQTRVTIGRACIFTYDVVLQCTTSMDIGDRAIVAQGTMLVDGNHRFRDTSKPVNAQGYDYRPLVVGADALILAKCTVVASVGERAVVGANSAVVKDVAPYTIAGGVPAREIDSFGPDGAA